MSEVFYYFVVFEFYGWCWVFGVFVLCDGEDFEVMDLFGV